MTEEEISEFVLPYKGDVEIFCLSAKMGGGMEGFENFINSKTICFAGQSAVGKTSIINTLLGTDNKTGELSRKIERGRNTTRQVEIFRAGNAKIVDTCGFSILTAVDIKFDELPYYYNDYVNLAQGCKYPHCTHTLEPQCAIKDAVDKGKLNKERYNRYLTLFNELKENWRKKYE